MEYTDNFIKIPIRIYDRFSVERAENEEKTTNTPMDGDWIMGSLSLKPQDIDWYSDYYDSTQGVAGVREEGFHNTLIITLKGDYFICMWNKAKFEDKLNSFVKKFSETLKKESEQIPAPIALSQNNS